MPTPIAIQYRKHLHNVSAKPTQVVMLSTLIPRPIALRLYSCQHKQNKVCARLSVMQVSRVSRYYLMSE